MNGRETTLQRTYEGWNSSDSCKCFLFIIKDTTINACYNEIFQSPSKIFSSFLISGRETTPRRKVFDALPSFLSNGFYLSKRQGDDPATDLRGVGLLGLLQMVYLVTGELTHFLAADVFALSHDAHSQFPMMVLLMQTKLLLFIFLSLFFR